MLLLPSLHRFGLHCIQAFAQLDRGDLPGYVAGLRKGLETCGDAKPMVEFLIDHTSALAQPSPPSPPSQEMAALADQIRKVLSAYAPDDPSVIAVKESDAYRRVAYLIEETADLHRMPSSLGV